MPQFKYKARDEKGTLHENVLIAETLVELRQQLKEKGLYLIDAEDAEAAKVKGMLDLDLDSLIGKYSKVKLRCRRGIERQPGQRKIYVRAVCKTP